MRFICLRRRLERNQLCSRHRRCCNSTIVSSSVSKWRSWINRHTCATSFPRPPQHTPVPSMPVSRRCLQQKDAYRHLTQLRHVTLMAQMQVVFPSERMCILTHLSSRARQVCRSLLSSGARRVRQPLGKGRTQFLSMRWIASEISNGTTLYLQNLDSYLE